MVNYVAVRDMGYIRLRGVCARVDDKSILDKVKSIREIIGTEQSHNNQKGSNLCGRRYCRS